MEGFTFIILFDPQIEFPYSHLSHLVFSDSPRKNNSTANDIDRRLCLWSHYPCQKERLTNSGACTYRCYHFFKKKSHQHYVLTMGEPYFQETSSSAVKLLKS